MSKVLRTVAVIAGAVALIATGVGAIGGAAFAATATGATVASIATWAGIAAGVASLGAMALAKKPPVRGAVNTIMIAALAAAPCLLGETYSAGVLRHDVGYGGKVGKVQNPYRGLVIVHSIGPTEAVVARYADFIQVPFSGAAATGYYSGFIFADTQLGATPEADALSPNFGGMPGWSSAHKLSGKAASLWNLKFDKDGKFFTSGVPQLGEVRKGVKCYDPRLDSTYPGGSGSHRLDTIATWEYTENPALHALSYIYGRHYDGKKVFGVGLPVQGIDIAAFVAWANVCDANGWKVGGIIYEPDDRWANLKRIMAAGSAEPIFAGGVLSVKYDAPRVSLVTITEEDLSDGPASVRAMQSWRERINTIIPRYRSPQHKWDYVDSDAVTSETYLDEDGEEKADTYTIELCQDKDQAAQLAAYRLCNGREMFPIEIALKPDFRFYKPGDMVTLNIRLSEVDALFEDEDFVIVRRSIDPESFAVRFTLMSETMAKHDFALGKTGTAPPTPTLLDPADRDDVAAINTGTDGARRLISQSDPFPVDSDDDSISIDAFTGVTDNGLSISFPSDSSLTGLASGTKYAVLWHIADEEYVAVEEPASAEMGSNAYVFIGWTSTSTSGTYPTPPTPPGGWGGSGPSWDGTLEA